MFIDLIRKTIRVTTTNFDDEISMHINSALKELELVGIQTNKLDMENLDPVVQEAIVLYVKAHFSRTLPEEHEGLMKAYEGAKSRLRIATGYADWRTT